MKLKTFMARDLKEALTQVKRELGPEAVILSTQSCRLPEAKAGWGRRTGVEVTAAVDAPSSLEYAGGEPYSPLPKTSLRHIQEELEELKGIFRQWLRQHGPPAWLYQHQELVVLFRALTKAGIAEPVLRRWLENIQGLLGRAGSDNFSLKEEALRCLMSSFAVVDPWKAKKGSRRLWTFVGPTGVGKTTTIAKLAVRFALMKKRRVGLISLDSQRLGAPDQLAAYGRIAGLPLKVVNRREDLLAAMDHMGNLDLLLIDTPGRSPHYPALQMEFHQLLGDLPQLEHHLVLSAAAQEGHLADAIRNFSVLPLSSCIITKIDESRDFSQVFNQFCQHGLPLSYLSMGQRVPEDLELATRRQVTELFLRPYHQRSYSMK